MMPFDVLFPDLASEETRVIRNVGRTDLPEGSYLFREFYCNEPKCDCWRALLHVHWVERKRVVATLNYAIEPEPPPFEDDPRVFIDPINPQSEYSDVLLRIFEQMIESDAEYHERLVRHYTMWKEIVDDPEHPDHAKVRSEHHGQASFRPAYPSGIRAEQKVGRNERCPCGSGKKYKQCCLKGSPARSRS
jgi:hypothetical protein